jgi:putative flippase GtrA
MLPTAAALRRGLRRPDNWRQLLRFGLVGLSGYGVNLTVFFLLVDLAGFNHRSGATVAFMVAVMNNFLLNRHWTFAARGGKAHRQAVRFFTVSVSGFLLNLGLLELLVTAGAPDVAAQAIAVAAVMPVNFLGNRLWTFRAER